ncbi:hypothetical protein [Streptomyces sp. CB00455]|uniref:hypothetical protein n=1 Tax=Streptomyces sp. CB00455 TaxID=1703927 RepID=UPI00093A12D2|nr:hypothetical protein [Streptomyces sp. CB00455]
MPHSSRVHQLRRAARSRASARTEAPASAADVPSPAPASAPTGIPEQQPRWATLERKEARLRRDQLRALAALRRQVARDRQTRDEIITDNTLIRVAVDFLLHHADTLTGDTEEQLLTSAVTSTTQHYSAAQLAAFTALTALQESEDHKQVFALCNFMIKALLQIKNEASARATTA